MRERVTYNLLDEEILKRKPSERFNYKFVEPPLLAYLVTTVDKYGNVNVTPTSSGSFLGEGPKGEGGAIYFSVAYKTTPQGRSREDRWTGMETSPRDAVYNLDEVPECVINYCSLSASLVEKMRIAALPIPKGISEMDIAGFTPLKSRMVTPPGIAECPVNMEAKVVHSKKLHGWKIYFLEIIGVHVDVELDERDKVNGHMAYLDADPLIKLHLENDSVFEIDEEHPYGDESKLKRCFYTTVDRSKQYAQEPYDIGPMRRWIGTFEIWMQDELNKGKITRQEFDEILELKENWLKNPEPVLNGSVKNELTDRIKKIIWSRK
ncbi:MAG TPA: hypothetical protein GXX14_00110 [Clostridiaceae bacterium]|nr:hypothetical protein [Clostridiaceae bacterium]